MYAVLSRRTPVFEVCAIVKAIRVPDPDFYFYFSYLDSITARLHLQRASRVKKKLTPLSAPERSIDPATAEQEPRRRKRGTPCHATTARSFIAISPSDKELQRWDDEDNNPTSRVAGLRFRNPILPQVPSGHGRRGIQKTPQRYRMKP